MTARPGGSSGRLVALLLHLSAMVLQIAERVPWADLARDARDAGARAAARLRSAADAIDSGKDGGDAV